MVVPMLRAQLFGVYVKAPVWFKLPYDAGQAVDLPQAQRCAGASGLPRERAQATKGPLVWVCAALLKQGGLYMYVSLYIS